MRKVINEEKYAAGKGFSKAAKSAGEKAVDQFFDRIEFDDEDEDEALEILANLGVYFLKGVEEKLEKYYPVDVYQEDVFKAIKALKDKDESKKESLKRNVSKR